MIDKIAPAAILTTPEVKTGTKIHQAAQQFEALLISQLLQSSRQASGSGWLGAGDDDQAGEIGMEVAEQQFAAMLAAGGGLGLAKMVEAGLKRNPENAEAIRPARPDSQPGSSRSSGVSPE